MPPVTRQSLVSLVVVVTISRVLWVLENQLMYSLLMGYDLDRNLTLQRNSWSIYNLVPSVILKSSRSKIGMDDDFKTASDLESGDPTHNNLARLGKELNRDELNAEIIKANRELVVLENFIRSLENMKFVVGDTNSSSGKTSESVQKYKSPSQSSKHPESPKHVVVAVDVSESGPNVNGDPN